MADGALVLVDLVVVAALATLIPVKVNLVILSLDVLKAEGFVPPSGEHVEADLPADAELQIDALQLCFERLDELLANLGALVKFLEVVAFLFRAVATDRGDVHHAIAIFQEGAPKIIRNNKHLPLNWNVQISDVAQGEVDELLQVVFT